MQRKIIVVEDNPADASTLKIALRNRDPDIHMIVLEDGALALEYFAGARAKGEPVVGDLVLLDLNLPRVSGFEVLEFLKSDPEFRKIPVVILSGSSSYQDIERCYAIGANSYICKPTGIDEVFGMVENLITYWFEQASLPVKLWAAAR